VKVKIPELYFSSCSEELPHGKCSMAWFIYSRFFSGSGGNRSVFVDVLQVIAQKRAS
jgi:hypothetical protein